MLTREEILSRLKGILIGMDNANRERADRVTEETKLVTELGLSSVGILYMVIAIEETFGIEFNDNRPFITVGDVVDFIEDNVK